MCKYRFILSLLVLNALSSANLFSQDTPGENFDLSAWKLQTLKESDGSFIEVNPINTHTSTFFYTNKTDDAMAFRVPSNGGTTSAGTSYPRVELRQVGDGANWLLSDINEQYLTAQCKVNEVAQIKPKTIIGQIHGSETNSELLKIRWAGYEAGKCYIEARFQNNDDEGAEYGVTLASGLSLGDTINYTITMTQGVVNVTINGNSASQTYTSQYYGTTDHYYFKAGGYIQWNESIVGATIVYGENMFYKLSLEKEIIPEPEPEPEPLSIIQANTNNSLTIYPNPSTGYIVLNLGLVTQSDAILEILDYSGRLRKRIILSNNHIVGENAHEISLSDLNSGIYYIRVISDQKSETKKLIISK